jgi:integrase
MRKRLGKYRGKWAVIWHDGKATRRRSLGTTDRALAEILYREDEHRQTVIQASQIITVGSVLDAYFEAKPTVVYRSHLTKYFRSYLPHHLTKDVIDRYVATRMGRAASTVRTELGILSSALRWGVKRGFVDKAPTIDLPDASPPREQWITKADADKIVAAATGHAKLFILLARYTGARSGAILDLKWERVTERFIDFNDPQKPRTRKRRAVVPMAAELWEALVEARRDAVTPYVVEYGGRKLATAKKSFARAAKKAGMPGVTPHVLRHSVATWLAMDGLDMGKIAGLLGNSRAMVEKVYAKYSPDYLSDAVDSLSRGQVIHVNRSLRDEIGTAAETETEPVQKPTKTGSR